MRFNQLVKRHRNRVYTLARYMLGNRQDAEDVTQEVLLRMWESRQTLDPETITPWILRVTRNACIDAFRKRSTFNRIIDVDSEAVGFGQATSSEPAPDHASESKEIRSRVLAEIALLPEPQRSAIIMRAVQDLRYDTIAEALGIPLNSVKVYIHRARQTLRKRLKDNLDYEQRFV